MTAPLQEELMYKRTLVPKTMTILSGETTSNLMDCGGMQPRAILFPSTWTSCNVSFNMSIVSETMPFYESYNLTNIDGSSLSIATVASQCLPILPYLTDFAPYFQVVCSAAQSQDAQVTLLLEPIYQGVHG